MEARARRARAPVLSLLPKPLSTSAQKVVYFAAPAVILNALRGLGERLGRGVEECATMLQPTVFELVRRQIDWREVGWQGPRNHHHPGPLDRRHHLHRHLESLRCEGSDAIGAKRTCRERRKRVDLTKMTHLRHWLCTAAIVLMPGFSPPIKVLVGGVRMPSPELGRG
jgi:hypothetical protein